jgi:hypothetical protein
VVADALSRSGVPNVALPLIADLDHMGVALCYVGTAREETRMLIGSFQGSSLCASEIRGEDGYLERSS